MNSENDHAIGEPRPIWMRLLTKQIQYSLDIVTLAVAFVLSYLLRFDFSIPPQEIHLLLIQLPLVILLQLAALFFAGVYSFIWRYVGMAEIKAFLVAAFSR